MEAANILLFNLSYVIYYCALLTTAMTYTPSNSASSKIAPFTKFKLPVSNTFKNKNFNSDSHFIYNQNNEQRPSKQGNLFKKLKNAYPSKNLLLKNNDFKTVLFQNQGSYKQLNRLKRIPSNIIKHKNVRITINTKIGNPGLERRDNIKKINRKHNFFLSNLKRKMCNLQNIASSKSLRRCHFQSILKNNSKVILAGSKKSANRSHGNRKYLKDFKFLRMWKKHFIHSKIPNRAKPVNVTNETSNSTTNIVIFSFDTKIVNAGFTTNSSTQTFKKYKKYSIGSDTTESTENTHVRSSHNTEMKKNKNGIMKNNATYLKLVDKSEDYDQKEQNISKANVKHNENTYSKVASHIHRKATKSCRKGDIKIPSQKKIATIESKVENSNAHQVFSRAKINHHLQNIRKNNRKNGKKRNVFHTLIKHLRSKIKRTHAQKEPNNEMKNNFNRSYGYFGQNKANSMVTNRHGGTSNGKKTKSVIAIIKNIFKKRRCKIEKNFRLDINKKLREREIWKEHKKVAHNVQQQPYKAERIDVAKKEKTKTRSLKKKLAGIMKGIGIIATRFHPLITDNGKSVKIAKITNNFEKSFHNIFFNGTPALKNSEVNNSNNFLHKTRLPNKLKAIADTSKRRLLANNSSDRIWNSIVAEKSEANFSHLNSTLTPNGDFKNETNDTTWKHLELPLGLRFNYSKFDQNRRDSSTTNEKSGSTASTAPIVLKTSKTENYKLKSISTNPSKSSTYFKILGLKFGDKTSKSSTQTRHAGIIFQTTASDIKYLNKTSPSSNLLHEPSYSFHRHGFSSLNAIGEKISRTPESIKNVFRNGNRKTDLNSNADIGFRNSHLYTQAGFPTNGGKNNTSTQRLQFARSHSNKKMALNNNPHKAIPIDHEYSQHSKRLYGTFIKNNNHNKNTVEMKTVYTTCSKSRNGVTCKSKWGSNMNTTVNKEFRKYSKTFNGEVTKYINETDKFKNSTGNSLSHIGNSQIIHQIAAAMAEHVPVEYATDQNFNQNSQEISLITDKTIYLKTEKSAKNIVSDKGQFRKIHMREFKDVPNNIEAVTPEWLIASMNMLNIWMNCSRVNISQSTLSVEEMMQPEYYLPEQEELSLVEMAFIDPSLQPIALISRAIKWILLGKSVKYS